MSKALTKALRKQHALYTTEAKANRRNFVNEINHPATLNSVVMAAAIYEQTMMIIRTEAKAKAIEELAEALGIAEQVAALVEGE